MSRIGVDLNEYAENVEVEKKPVIKVTEQMLLDKIAHEQYYVFPDSTVTVCLLTLKNGFKVVGHSATVSPEEFDPAVGEKWAKEKAVDKMWELEGYLLKDLIARGEAPTQEIEVEIEISNEEGDEKKGDEEEGESEEHEQGESEEEEQQEHEEGAEPDSEDKKK